MRTRITMAVATVFVTLSALAEPPGSDKNIAREREMAEKFDLGKKWAVVIGVNDYIDSKIADLKYCVADAKLLSTVLAEQCGYEAERILTITDDQPQAHLRPLRRNLHEQVANWLKRSEPSDTVLVFFSGHGFLDQRGQGFLATQDAEPGNLGLTALRTDELRDMLQQCKAAQKLLVLDCCHAGTNKGSEAPGPSSQELGLAFQKAAGLLFLASCDRNEESREWDAKGHGLFTWYLADGLRGGADYDRDGVVDSNELYRFTFDRVSLTAQRDLGSQQTPKLNTADAVGVFALARVGDAVVRPTRRQVTATFTVREGNEQGPLLPGAKLELLWRETPGGEAVVLGSATSDTQGRAAISAWLDGKQQAKGDFLVLVGSVGGTQPWSLPGFPESASWNLYASVSRPVPPPTMPRIETPNQSVITNSIEMKLVLIPTGEFLMGSPDSDGDALGSEKPQHPVQITEPFYLGATEVTQGQYERVMGENPSNYTGDPQRPVEMVSWEEAVEFCRRLSQQEGKTYRLPTEAQWEYACRAGSTAKWHFGDEQSRLGDYAWYESNSDRTTHPVGQKKANAWGLYDMHGNVWEWCADWYDEEYYGKSATTKNPTGPASASGLVFRGGGWDFDAWYCRSAFRCGYGPAYQRDDLGFRVALVPTGR